MILMTMTGEGPLIAPDTLEHALRTRYPQLHVARSASKVNAVNISVLADDFQPIVNLSETMSTISIDGSWDEAVEIATVVRAALPASGPDLVLINDDGSSFVDVSVGSTPASLDAGWRDIEEYPGFGEA